MPDKTPHHNAFEAEEKTSELRYVYVVNPPHNTLIVHMNTGQPRLVNSFGPTQFPFHCTSALELFILLYQRVVDGANNMRLLGYVDPVTFQPMEREHEEV